MSGELYIILCSVLGAFLFALGGTEIPFFKTGFKWLRREVLPISWALLAHSAGIDWWRCIGMAVCFDIAFRLPYGDRTPVLLKAVVFAVMPFASLWIGITAWQFIAGPLAFLMWCLSNWRPTERIFNWVISCLFIGAYIGVTVGQLIANTVSVH